MSQLTKIVLLASAGAAMWGQSAPLPPQTLRQDTRRAEAPPVQIAQNRPAPAAAGGNGGGGGLDGLYFMTRFSSVTGLETAAYWFHDGTAVINPIGSAKTLDVQAERATHPRGVGTYQLEGGQLRITFPGSNPQAKFVPTDHGCFEWDTGIFCPVQIFKPGTTLDGTYTGGVSAAGGALMASSDFTFKRDGTYQCDSAASFSTRGRTGETSGEAVGKERGKYRIDGTAMHMIPDGGKETLYTTFPLFDDGSLYFGSRVMSRLK